MSPVDRDYADDRDDRDRPDTLDDSIPPADWRLLGAAGVLLALPVLALLWVASYAHPEPRLGGFPFFIWYQFLWVFLASGCTYAAYRLVLRGRPHRPMTGADDPDAGSLGGPRRSGGLTGGRR